MQTNRRTLAEIAELIGGVVAGNGNLEVNGVAGLAEAQPGDLSFLTNPKYAHELAKTRATAVIAAPQVKDAPCALIHVPNPDIAFSKATEAIMPPLPVPDPGIHPTAIIAADAVIGTGVTIGAYAVVENGARIGDRTVLWPGVFVGERTVLGADCVVHPNAVIYHDCLIGTRVILHAGVVIGCDGFGYSWDGTCHRKIPQRGLVVLGDDVEIGSNTVVDRARFGRTVVDTGTKLDNLIQIAHNVRVGKHCVFAALSGVSGSTKVGDYTMMGGQAATVGHIDIAPRTIISAKSVATRSSDSPEHITGFPARPHAEFLRDLANIRKIGEMRSIIKDLTRRIEALESQTENHS